MKSIACSVNLSGPSIARVIDIVSYGLSSLPNTISIDEFNGNAGRKFQCILTNPRKQEILDILPERTIEGLSAHFSILKTETTLNILLCIWVISPDQWLRTVFLRLK